VGGQRVAVTVHDEADLPVAARALTALGGGAPAIDRDGLVVTLQMQGRVDLVAVLRALDGCGVATADVALRGATMDDVFISLTGHGALEEEAA
jgi:hypothetical protein